MKRVLAFVLRLVWVSVEYANEEITVDLPGDAMMEFVWIEPGTFTMGSPGWELGREDWDWPQHQVATSQGFYLGKYEISQEQWVRVAETTPWAGEDNMQEGPRYPAVNISWEDLQSFIHLSNEAAGDSLYRLPTEAEWEYACRAGTITRWSFGEDDSQLGAYAWYDENAWNAGLGYAQTVGMKRPNLWGLYDMHGNVAEWCQGKQRGYTAEAQIDPVGPASGPIRIVRGGSFGYPDKNTRSAWRGFYLESGSGTDVGARLLKIGVKMDDTSTPVAPQSWRQIKDDSH